MSSPPSHVIRLDAIIVRIRRRTTRSGVRHSVSISRFYHNGDTLKESTRFSRNDLPIIRAALDEAFTWIAGNGQLVEPQ
ncbi:MAG: hypothetical protein KDB01_01985 [Planctomycetaceae bacterium]|nr:hypothetical protein [Planctomycetaceae bacterium]